MIYHIDNINYVITGRNQKMVNLTMTTLPSVYLAKDGEFTSGDYGKTYCRTYVTDEGQDILSTFHQEYCTHRLKTLSSDSKSFEELNILSTIYSLFDMKDVAIKSPVKKSKITEDENYDIVYSKTLVDHFNSHLSVDPLEFCQLNGSAIGLALENKKFPALKKTNLIDTRYDRLVNGQNSLDWHFKITSDENDTFTYVPLSSLVRAHLSGAPLSTYIDPIGYYYVMKSCKGLSNEALDYFFGNDLSNDLSINLETGRLPILFNHKSVDVNEIFNVRVDNGLGSNPEYSFNDFNNGIIQGATYLGKNDYDAEFSMNMDSVEDIHHARNYIGLGNVGGRLFLKYYDEIEYEGKSKEDTGNGIINIPSERKDPSKRSYQNVEIYDSTNSFLGNYSRHKANLYAITVKNAGLGQDSSPELRSNLEKIRAQVANSIRTIAENLAPAHTQLLQVNFEDNWSNIALNFDKQTPSSDISVDIPNETSTRKEIEVSEVPISVDVIQSMHKNGFEEILKYLRL